MNNCDANINFMDENVVNQSGSLDFVVSIPPVIIETSNAFENGLDVATCYILLC